MADANIHVKIKGDSSRRLIGLVVSLKMPWAKKWAALPRRH